MRACRRNTITQYVCIIIFAVILPVHCMIHCAHHDTADKPRSPFVCILDAHVSQAHTQLLPQAYQPTATHEAVSLVLFQNVVYTVHERIAQSLHQLKHSHSVRPDYPPPRRHALSSYSL